MEIIHQILKVSFSIYIKKPRNYAYILFLLLLQHSLKVFITVIKHTEIDPFSSKLYLKYMQLRCTSVGRCTSSHLHILVEFHVSSKNKLSLPKQNQQCFHLCFCYLCVFQRLHIHICYTFVTI